MGILEILAQIKLSINLYYKTSTTLFVIILFCAIATFPFTIYFSIIFSPSDLFTSLNQLGNRSN